jgi:hypothetical protein
LTYWISVIDVIAVAVPFKAIRRTAVFVVAFGDYQSNAGEANHEQDG